MSNAGIAMDPAVAPDPDSFRSVLDYLDQYLQSLDGDLRAGLAIATTDDPVSVALADSEVGAVDSGYSALLAFDNATGFSLSLCLQWCRHCLEQAAVPATN